MAPTVKVLVLGATGPSGICVLRELLHREHATVAYVRDASKIPEELKKNMLLEVGSFSSPPMSRQIAANAPRS
jgi:putative NADH-flavin reductase